MADPRIARLVTLANLMRDDRLARLSAAVARRDATISLRDGLVAPGSDDPAALQAQAVYGQWVERRRAALGAQIDRQSEEVDTEMGRARTAFARAEVLSKLRDQLS